MEQLTQRCYAHLIKWEGARRHLELLVPEYLAANNLTVFTEPRTGPHERRFVAKKLPPRSGSVDKTWTIEMPVVHFTLWSVAMEVDGGLDELRPPPGRCRKDVKGDGDLFQYFNEKLEANDFSLSNARSFSSFRCDESIRRHDFTLS